MSDVAIGYAPAEGRLILGQHRDAAGRWVEPLYPHDDMMVAAPTELDKAVLGVDTEQVIVVWRNSEGEERYRVATDMSWHGLDAQDAAREDEILRGAAHSRVEPDEDHEPFDPRTLTAKPAGSYRGANGDRLQLGRPTGAGR